MTDNESVIRAMCNRPGVKQKQLVREALEAIAPPILGETALSLLANQKRAEDNARTIRERAADRRLNQNEKNAIIDGWKLITSPHSTNANSVWRTPEAGSHSSG